MILNYIYNSLENKNDEHLEVLKEILEKGIEDIQITMYFYDMSYPKDAKKGRAILNKYAAKELPTFQLTTDNKEKDYFMYMEGRSTKLTSKEIIETIKLKAEEWDISTTMPTK